MLTLLPLSNNIASTDCLAWQIQNPGDTIWHTIGTSQAGEACTAPNWPDNVVPTNFFTAVNNSGAAYPNNISDDTVSFNNQNNVTINGTTGFPVLINQSGGAVPSGSSLAGFSTNSAFSGSAATVTATQDSTSYMFGTGSAVFTAGNTITGSFGSSNQTAECWVKCASFSGNQQVMGNQLGASGTGLALYLNNGVPTLIGGTWVSSGGNLNWAVNIVAGSALSTGSWHHLAIVTNGTNIILYVDGVSIGSAAFTSNITTISGFQIGTASYGPNLSGIAQYARDFGSLGATQSGNGSGTIAYNTAQQKFGAGSVTFTNQAFISYVATNTQNYGTGDFTVEGWIYPTGTCTGGQIFGTGSYGYSNPIDSQPSLCFTTGNAVTYTANNQVNSVHFTSSSSLVSNVWTHVALVRHSGTTTLYFNGISVGSIADTIVIATGSITNTSITLTGAGYTDGTYTNVPLTGGFGSGAKATIVIIFNIASSVTITTVGSGYKSTDILSEATLSNTGSRLTCSISINNGNAATIGSSLNYQSTPFSVDEVRYSNTARYTSSFTPPAAAFSSDANTMLLSHFDKLNVLYSAVGFAGNIDELRLSTNVRYSSGFTPGTQPFIPDAHASVLMHFDPAIVSAPTALPSSTCFLNSSTADIPNVRIFNLTQGNVSSSSSNIGFSANSCTICASTNQYGSAAAGTTTSLALTYSSSAGTLTASSNGVQVIDGYTPNPGDLVLVKNQSPTYQNGVYSCTVNSSGSPFTLTSQAKPPVGQWVKTVHGTVQAGQSWIQTSGASMTLPLSACEFIFTDCTGTGNTGGGSGGGGTGSLNFYNQGTLLGSINQLDVEGGALVGTLTGSRGVITGTGSGGSLILQYNGTALGPIDTLNITSPGGAITASISGTTGTIGNDALRWIGDWEAGIAYEVNDVVMYNPPLPPVDTGLLGLSNTQPPPLNGSGNAFVCTVAHTSTADTTGTATPQVDTGQPEGAANWDPITALNLVTPADNSLLGKLKSLFPDLTPLGWLAAGLAAAGLVAAGIAVSKAISNSQNAANAANAIAAGVSASTVFTGTAMYSQAYTPPSLQQVIASLCAQIMPIGQYDVSLLPSNIRCSLVLGQVTQIRDLLNTFAQVFLFDMVDSSGILRFVPRNSTPVGSLAYTDMAFNPQGVIVAPVTYKRMQSVDLPRSIQLSYCAVDLDYNKYTQITYLPTFSDGQDLVIDVPLVLDHATAKMLSEQILINAHLERQQFTFMCAYRNCVNFEPGDIITIPDGNVRILTMEEREEGVIEFVTCMAGFTGAPTPIIVGGVTIGYSAAAFVTSGQPAQLPPVSNAVANSTTSIGYTSAFWVDPPVLNSTDQTPRIFAVVNNWGATAWGGASIMRSTDGGNSYQTIATTNVATPWGHVSTVIPAAEHWYWDDTTVIQVTMKYGTLTSAPDDSVLSGTNLCMIGNECIAYGVATLVSAGVYNLTHLLRGRQGTEWAVGTHVADELFYPLDDTLLEIPGSDATRNIPYLYKVVTNGSSASLVSPDTVAIVGQNTIPWTVANPVIQNSAGTFNISWLERPRFINSLLDLTDDPHDPDFAGYCVAVASTVSTTAGPAMTVGTITGGAYYADGTYDNIPAIGGSGTGLTISATVTNGAVSSVLLRVVGKNYKPTDTITVPNSSLGNAKYIAGAIISGTFDIGETLTQSVSGATAVLVSINGDGTLSIGSITGTPLPTTQWTGGTSGAQFNPSIVPTAGSGFSFTVGSIAIRTAFITDNAYNYTPAMQLSDFGGAQTHITANVYQVSNKYGGGKPLTVSI